MTMPFAKSERSTIGLEWELQLIDADSLDLRQCAEAVLTGVQPPGQSPALSAMPSSPVSRIPLRMAKFRPALTWTPSFLPRI